MTRSIPPVDQLTDKSAQDIVDRIDQQAKSKTGIRSLPIRPKDYDTVSKSVSERGH